MRLSAINAAAIVINLLATAHARSVGASVGPSAVNQEPANYAYAEQQPDEYVESPASRQRGEQMIIAEARSEMVVQNVPTGGIFKILGEDRCVRRVANEIDSYDKDYSQENLREEPKARAVQRAQYQDNARFNGEDDDVDLAQSKEDSARQHSYSYRGKAVEANLNEDMGEQQEEEIDQQNNIDTADEGKEPVDNYRSVRQNQLPNGVAARRSNVAPAIEPQLEETEDAALDVVGKMAADYQNLNEPANLQQPAKAESAGRANAERENAAASNSNNYKEYAQEDEESDLAEAQQTGGVINKEGEAPAQYDQVVN